MQNEKLEVYSVTQAIEEIKKCSVIKESHEIITKIEKIQQICDKEYEDTNYYGDTALNRSILRDPDIATLLTPDVLKYIFTTKTCINLIRNGPAVELKIAIESALLGGLEALQYMTGNEGNMSPAMYEKQKENFHNNTKKIISNIGAAIDKKINTTVQAPQTDNLLKQFKEVCATVNIIKKNKGNKQLLAIASDYTLNDMQKQAKDGFEHLLYCIQKSHPLDHPLQDLAKAFLNSPDALLNGYVIHLFYDRAHIIAALEQDTEYNFADKSNCTFQDIFRAMVTELCANPQKYPIAVEQFVTRFNLVEVDLQNRFPKELLQGKLLVQSASQEIKGSKDILNIEKQLEKPENDKGSKTNIFQSILNYLLQKLYQLLEYLGLKKPSQQVNDFLNREENKLEIASQDKNTKWVNTVEQGHKINQSQALVR